MTIQRFETGPRMSQVVIHGDTIYLAGVVATKAGGESVTRQTQEVLSIIDSHLAKAGSDKSKLLTATIYLTDMKTFPEMNAGGTAGYRLEIRRLAPPSRPGSPRPSITSRLW